MGPDRWDKAQIVVQRLNSDERTVVVERGSNGWYKSTGHIVYAAGGSLFAVRFDPRNVVVSGGPVPVVEGVRRAVAGTTGVAHFTFSASGSLIYLPGPATGLSAQFELD